MLSFNRALIWKEWRQHRWLFGLAFILMSLQPIFQTVWYWAGQVVFRAPGGQLPVPDAWSLEIARMFNQNTHSITALGSLVAIFLGIHLIAGERANSTLDFLVSGPVGRREIIAAKYFVGAGVIAGILLVNFLFAAGAAMALPAKYTIAIAAKWFALAGAMLLVNFSMGFFAAVITGNWWAALICNYVLFLLPQIISSIVFNTVNIFTFLISGRAVGSWFINTVNHVEQHFSPFYYLNIDARRLAGEAVFTWDIPALLLAALVFFLLAARLFESNPLERNGEISIFGGYRVVVKAILALIGALIGSALIRNVFKPEAPVIPGVFLGVFVAGYIFLSFFFRRRRRPGVK